MTKRFKNQMVNVIDENVMDVPMLDSDIIFEDCRNIANIYKNRSLYDKDDNFDVQQLVKGSVDKVIKRFKDALIDVIIKNLDDAGIEIDVVSDPDERQEVLYNLLSLESVEDLMYMRKALKEYVATGEITQEDVNFEVIKTKYGYQQFSFTNMF